MLSVTRILNDHLHQIINSTNFIDFCKKNRNKDIFILLYLKILIN